MATKATLHYTGDVEWKPPAIYHSSCEMDVEYFPFDEQTCVMKFGSWTYDGYQVDLRHIDEENGKPEVEIGVDLTEFYMSVEWDILEVGSFEKSYFSFHSSSDFCRIFNMRKSSSSRNSSLEK